MKVIAAIRKCAQLRLFVVLSGFALEELACWAEQVKGEGFHTLKCFHIHLLSGRFSGQLGKVPVVVTPALKQG